MQTQKDLNWDEILTSDQIHEWQCICKQVEQSAEFHIPQSVGSRDSEYRLIACSDASKEALGCCFYLYDFKTDKCTFLAGKNRMVGGNLKTKSIPVLELIALSWANEVCIDFCKFYWNFTLFQNSRLLSDLNVYAS